MNGNSFSGHITVLSVLLLVFYTTGPFDQWDFGLGFIGVYYCWKHFEYIKSNTTDKFNKVLVSIIMGLSFSAIIFSITNYCYWFKDKKHFCNLKLEYLDLEYFNNPYAEFIGVLFFSSIALFLIFKKSK